MNLFIFVIIVSLVALGTAQYYYVQQPTVYFPPIQHTYFPRQHYQPFVNVPPVPQIQRTTYTPHVPQVQRTTFAQNNDMEYRGFAYHTRNDNGATSHVLFVTGPQAQQINTRGFNNFQQDYKENVNHAKTIASEMLDPVNKMTEQKVLPQNIQDLYAPPMMQKVSNNDPFTFFQNMFKDTHNPISRVINFYSRNTDLFASQVPGYPANVAPLPYDINAINPRFLTQDQQNNTKIDEQTTDKNTEEAAESIVTNTRFKFNDNENQVQNIIEISNKNNANNGKQNNKEIQSESQPTTIIPLKDFLRVTSESFFSTSASTSSPSPSTQRAEVDSTTKLLSSENPTTFTSELSTTDMPEKSTEGSFIEASTQQSSIKDVEMDVHLEDVEILNTFTSANNDSGSSGMATSTEGDFTTVEDGPASEATTEGFTIPQQSGFSDLALVSMKENDTPSSSESENSVSENGNVNSTNPRSARLSINSPTEGVYTSLVSDSDAVKYSQDLMDKKMLTSPDSASRETLKLSTSGNLTSETLGADTSTTPMLLLSGSSTGNGGRFITDLNNNLSTAETTSTDIMTSEAFMTTVTENVENTEDIQLFTSTVLDNETPATETTNENVTNQIVSTTETSTVDQ